MSARVTWQGLAELRAELRRLPVELVAEATPIVADAPEAARREIEAAYPERAGSLRRGLSVQVSERGAFGVYAVVRNRAKHAKIFEVGTQARHTSLGANRGSMPPGHVFVPKVIEHRRRMYERLADLVRSKGFTVSGQP